MEMLIWSYQKHTKRSGAVKLTHTGNKPNPNTLPSLYFMVGP